MASASNTGNNRWSMDSWDRENVRYIRKISRSLINSERELLEENNNTTSTSSFVKKPEIKRQDAIYEKSIPKKILNKYCPPPTPRRNSVTKLSAGADNPMDLENCYLIDILTVRNESVMTYKKSPKLSELFSKNSESSSDVESETSSTSIGLDLEGTTSESSCYEGDDLCSKMSSKQSYTSSNAKIMKGKCKDRNPSISTKYPGSTGTETSNNSGGFSPFPSSSTTTSSFRSSSSIISKNDEQKQTQVQEQQQNNIKDELCPFCCNNKYSTATPASTVQIQQTGSVPASSKSISNKEKYFYLGEEVEERSLRAKQMSPSGSGPVSPCSDEIEIMSSQNIPEPMAKLPSSPYYIRLSRDIPKILQQPPPNSRNFAMNKQGLLMVDYSSNWDGLETFTRKLNLKS